MNTCPEVPEYFLSKVFTPHIVNDDLMIRKELCVEDDDITITINAFIQVMSVVFPETTWQLIASGICILLALLSGCVNTVKSSAQSTMRLALLVSCLSCTCASIGLGFCTYQIKYALENIQCGSGTLNNIVSISTGIGLFLSVFPGVMSVMCIFIPFVCFRSIIIVKRITNILVVMLSLSIFLITTIDLGTYATFHNTTCVTFVPDVRFYDAMDLSSALLTFSSISMVLITYSLYSVKIYPKITLTPATTPSLRI